MKNTSVPNIDVGIMSATEIHFTLNGAYKHPAGHRLNGVWHARLSAGNVLLTKGQEEYILSAGSVLEPALSEGCSFALHEVTIGIGFHWERREDQVFEGALRLIIEQGKLTVVNRLSLEDYLTSVISS